MLYYYVYTILIHVANFSIVLVCIMYTLSIAIIVTTIPPPTPQKTKIFNLILAH